jgi:hypothetical protein
MTVVRLSHARQLGYCAQGMRDFAARHGLDWQRFITEGLPGEQFLATGDAMALEVVKVAQQQEGGF